MANLPFQTYWLPSQMETTSIITFAFHAPLGSAASRIKSWSHFVHPVISLRSAMMWACVCGPWWPSSLCCPAASFPLMGCDCCLPFVLFGLSSGREAGSEGQPCCIPVTPATTTRLILPLSRDSKAWFVMIMLIMTLFVHDSPTWGIILFL